MTVKEKSDLLAAIKRYGQAEVEFGKAILDQSMPEKAFKVGVAFGEVVNIINRL